MSAIGNFLTTELDRTSVTGIDLAARMGIDRTQFSRLLNGRVTSCNVETLAKMVQGVSEEPGVRAAFLQAYFRDQCLTRYKPWVSVDPEGPSSLLREEPARYSAPRTPDPEAALLAELRALHLPHKVLEALMDIARFIPGRHKFRVVIEDLGNFARGELDPTK